MILEILNELDSTLKTKQKETILRKYADNELLKEIFRITYNKQIMFHVKKFPVVEGKPGTTPLSMAIESLKSDLATRNFTGNAARDRLEDIVSSVNANDRNVLRRIINRDLECGVSTALANKVWKDLIPEQPQCLATPFSEKALKRIDYPAYSQLKADGARCMADMLDDDIRKVSRAGNEYTGLVDLDKSLRIIRDILGADYVMDGELIYVSAQAEPSISLYPAKVQYNFKKPTDEEMFEVFAATPVPSLNWLMDDDSDPVLDSEVSDPVGLPINRPSTESEQAAEAKREEGNGIVNKSLKGTITHEEQKCIVFQVWDLIPYTDYYTHKQSSALYRDRLALLERTIKKSGVTNIQLIPSKIVYNFGEAKKDYNDYRNEGKEGSILKNMDFCWKDSRVADQVKLKNKTPIDLRIVEIYPHTKEPHKAGGFVVEDLSGMARTNTGSGLKDTDYRYDEDEITRVYIPLDERDELDREYIMANKGRYIGAIVEMEVDGLQTSKTRKAGEPEYSFFLPIIKKMRWDKSQPNDIRDVFADLF